MDSPYQKWALVSWSCIHEDTLLSACCPDMSNPINALKTRISKGTLFLQTNPLHFICSLVSTYRQTDICTTQYSPTHSPTHPLTYSLTHSLTHLLTHSLTHLLTHSLTQPLTHPLTHSLVHCRSVLMCCQSMSTLEGNTLFSLSLLMLSLNWQRQKTKSTRKVQTYTALLYLCSQSVASDQ